MSAAIVVRCAFIADHAVGDGLQAVPQPTVPGETGLPAAGGLITITRFMHASVQIEHAGKVIQVDPAMGDLSKASRPTS